MIPLRDQEVLRERFKRDLTSRVRIDYFTQRSSPVIIPGRQECPYCEDVKTLMTEIASLSDRLSLSQHDIEVDRAGAAALGVDKVPATVIRGQTNRPLRFFGVPAGTNFPGFIETMIEASRGEAPLTPETMKQLRRLKQDVKLQILVTPACAYSAPVAHLASRLALQSVRIKTDIIEVAEFPQYVEHYGLRVTPTIIIDETLVLPGALDEAGLMEAILRHVEGKPPLQAPQVATGTPLALPSQQGQTAPKETVTASGLILPGR